MKRLQIMLAMMGTIAMIAGAFIIASSVTIAAPADQSDDLSRQPIVYVGTNTCFTCHNDLHQDGWHALHPQVIQSPVASPQVILADINAAQAVRQINTGSETRAYTADDVSYTVSNGPIQRYIMRTEDGYTVLPGTWIMSGEYAEEAETTEWIQNCAGCHESAGKHIRLAQQLEPDAGADALDAVRSAIVTTIDPVLCKHCQDVDSHTHQGAAYNPVGETPFTSIVLTSAVGGKTSKQHFLQAALWGKPSAHPSYRREYPTR